MDAKLTDPAVRVLGCLVEKELATPEYYPLSLNGLVSACNQKNNREPAMALEQEDVADALDQLRSVGLALQAAESARVPRYGHNLRGKLHLADEQSAVLCELLLRGPQTAGELRGRASRLHALADVAEVERVLQTLIERAPALVAKLPLQPGHKEQRYVQLLGGEAPVAAAAPAPDATPAQPRRPADARPGGGAPTPVAGHVDPEPVALP
ncbi:MAG: YceH family protein, partial [Deltaproteobacteria bacterium]|nr:YceH family protein [Deltaproteobacteria bacterium]